jgi:hypothetical protein
MNAPALRARSVGEILDLSFQLYRSRWAQMAVATGLLVLPLLVLEAIAPLEAFDTLEQLGNLFYLAASAAVVVIASGAYMGREVSAAESIRAVGSRFFSVWGAAIIQGFLIIIGLILLVIPGIFAMIYTFAMQQAVMIEGKTASESWERSKSLAEDELKHILLTSVMAFIIVFIAMFGVGVALSYAPLGERMTIIVVNIIAIALNPLTAVVGTVLYYDLRIRKEAFDVAVATERLGDTEPTPAPAL